MNKKLIGIVSTFMILIVGLCGCNEQTDKENMNTIAAPINILGLSLDDLSGEFELTGEEYNTTLYVVEEGILKDTIVLERYNAGFTAGKNTIISQAIMRCESKESCISALNKLKTQLRTGYSETAGNTIGEDSYLGEKIINTSGTKVTEYQLVFRIADVLVVLSGVSQFELDFREYGHIIESNMNEYVE